MNRFIKILKKTIKKNCGWLACYFMISIFITLAIYETGLYFHKNLRYAYILALVLTIIVCALCNYWISVILKPFINDKELEEFITGTKEEYDEELDTSGFD